MSEIASRLTLLCQLLATAAAPLAADQVDFTVTPSAFVYSLPEPDIGEVKFTITNNLNVPLTVGGYNADPTFLFGDDDDNFYADPLGAIPYVIPANSPKVVSVEIVPDLEYDDEFDILGGVWSLGLFPVVYVGQNPNGGVAGLPVATGSNAQMAVHITDAPAPEPASLMLAGTVLLLWAARARLKKHA